MSEDGFPFSKDSRDYQQGVELMRRVLGQEEAAHIEGMVDHPLFGEQLGWLFSKTWGALYHRNILSIRERALVLMGTDLALGREGPLKDHMRAALYGGLTPEQVMEAMFQAAIYVGVPSLPMGMRVAMEVMGDKSASSAPASTISQRRVKMTDNDLGIRMGPINHVAMAVKDWENSAKGYASLMGLKTWRVMEIPSQIMEKATYYGEPADFVWISAFAKMGDTLIELCQHVSGKTPFGDHVDQHGDGMQHVGDLSHQAPDKLVKAWSDVGVEAGLYCSIPGMVELYFLDTRKQLGGMFLEVLSPPSYAQIADMGEDVIFD